MENDSDFQEGTLAFPGLTPSLEYSMDGQSERAFPDLGRGSISGPLNSEANRNNYMLPQNEEFEIKWEKLVSNREKS